ncbi:MAG: hypothetical protein RXO54_05530 [Acidilobus sp.]
MDSIGVVGGLRHLTCGCGRFSPTLLSREPYNVGDTVPFEVTRYNLYKDGKPVEK